MTATQTYLQLQELLSFYITELDNYSEDEFHTKKDEETWSLGQMYEHLVIATRGLFMQKINNCLSHARGSLEGEKTLEGEKIFHYGTFPPIKIKVPEQWQGPQPEAKAKESYKEVFTELLKDLKELGERVEEDSSNYKTKHVQLGFLNASEWYKVMEMHFRHHLRQKKELEEWLKSK